MAAVVVDREESGSPPLGVLKKHRNRKKERHREDVGREEWVELGQSLFFVSVLKSQSRSSPSLTRPSRQFYTSLLSFLTITITNSRLSRYVHLPGGFSSTLTPWLRRDRSRIKRHLAPLLFAAFALYFYRNVWPLCTFHGKPKDLALHRKGGDGWRSLTWWRCALLGVAGVLVPLLVPRTYEPSDPSVSPWTHPICGFLELTIAACPASSFRRMSRQHRSSRTPSRLISHPSSSAPGSATRSSTTSSRPSPTTHAPPSLSSGASQGSIRGPRSAPRVRRQDIDISSSDCSRSSGRSLLPYRSCCLLERCSASLNPSRSTRSCSR